MNLIISRQFGFHHIRTLVIGETGRHCQTQTKEQRENPKRKKKRTEKEKDRER